MAALNTQPLLEREERVALINRLLPVEMLERVFHLLPPRDLEAVVLVCRWWREVGEAPALWVWVCLWVGRNIGYMAEVLNSRRLQAVRRMEVREVSKELLQAVVRHPGLKVMGIRAIHSSVDPELLAQAVTQLEGVDVVGTTLTPQQVTAICTAMTGNSQLKTLDLSGNNLSSVDADILAQAVAQLEEVGLRNTYLSLQKLETIFAAIDTSSQIKVLRIGVNNLFDMDPEMLARVLNKLETVDVWLTQLTEQQMTRILTRSLHSTNLKRLDMGCNSREGVEEGLRIQAEKVIKELSTERLSRRPART